MRLERLPLWSGFPCGAASLVERLPLWSGVAQGSMTVPHLRILILNFYGGGMYTVFFPKRRIVFSASSAEACYERELSTAKEVFFCGENEFTPEERSIEEIYWMIAGGFAFFPVNEGARARDIRDFIKTGFEVAFMRAGDFKRFKKDYKDFM